MARAVPEAARTLPAVIGWSERRNAAINGAWDMHCRVRPFHVD
jgi:hypothetical protein